MSSEYFERRSWRDAKTDGFPARALPYGYWFDPESENEWLFDREYAPIWHRALRHPDRAVWASPRPGESGGATGWVPRVLFEFAAWFYTDANPPGQKTKEARETAERCGIVMGRFLSGGDVRTLFQTVHEDYLFPDGVTVHAIRANKK